jgi:hypothetical protein
MRFFALGGGDDAMNWYDQNPKVVRCPDCKIFIALHFRTRQAAWHALRWIRMSQLSELP